MRGLDPRIHDSSPQGKSHAKLRASGMTVRERVPSAAPSAHEDDPEGALHAVMLGDRDVVALLEAVLLQLEHGLVVLLGARVVGKGPAPADLDDLAGLVVLAFPEPPHRAVLLVRFPGRRIEPPVLVERQVQLVAAVNAAFRMIRGARQLEPHVFQRHAVPSPVFLALSAPTAPAASTLPACAGSRRRG